MNPGKMSSGLHANGVPIAGLYPSMPRDSLSMVNLCAGYGIELDGNTGESKRKRARKITCSPFDGILQLDKVLRLEKLVIAFRLETFFEWKPEARNSYE